jgi:hypothetical protein
MRPTFVLSEGFFVPRALFFVPRCSLPLNLLRVWARSCLLVLGCAFVVHADAANEEPSTKNQEPGTGAAEPFRPEAGKFPPLEKAHSYRGELVFVDHANRRGSLRVQSKGYFYRNPPHPFAMLPYGIIRYHGAPADLRDIPLGTMLHVRAFLPPDPKTSSVPVLPVDNKENTAGFRQLGSEPAENHVLLLEDEPSHCLREGKVWKLKEARVEKLGGLIIATCEPKAGTAAKVSEEKLHFDSSTRIHRGRESLTLKEWMAEDAWPAEGTKSLGGRAAQLGIDWRPTFGGVVKEGLPFTSFHIADIWLDDTSLQRAADYQTERHKVHMRAYWLPAWIDSVEYGKLGRATVTATLFGGMDPSLYAEFKPGVPALINPSENTLKHRVTGSVGPMQNASNGSIRDVIKATGDIPLGSSGIQIRFETGLIIEGIRTGRIVRVRPAEWPNLQVPRDEYLGHDFKLIERFPTPAIFPTY